MLYVPLITPLSTSGSVDLGCLASLADGLLSDGADGLVALGTTGEPSSLSTEEQSSVVSVVAEVCAARGAPLMVGGSTVYGVWPRLVLVPPFVRAGEEGVLAYFSQLASSSPVPLIVYHVPHRSGQALSSAALLRFAELPSVVGMKYAPGVLDASSMALFAGLPEPFSLLCGDDALLASMLALGASGAITASAHVATSSYAALISAWRRGDLATARPLGHRIGKLSSLLFAEPNPTVIKGVLHALGRIPTMSVRLPLLPASSSTVDAALDFLASFTDNGRHDRAVQRGARAAA
jgi:4-hydroxy-tetrahydrodipicolinate synthase